MKLLAIKLNQFKGHNGELPPGEIMLLLGPNGSGKSAYLQALRWAVTGVSPAGSRLDDAAKFFGPTGGSVTVAAEGLTFTRRIKVDKVQGKVSETVSIEGRPGISKSEAVGIVGATLGNFLPMWDVDAFLSLSPDKRREFLLDLCSTASGESADAEGLADKMRTEAECILVTDEWNMITPEGLVTLEEIGTELATGAGKVALATIRGRLAGEMADLPESAAIRVAADVVAQWIKDSKAIATEASAAARSLSERRAKVEPVSALLGALEAEREALSGNLKQAQLDQATTNGQAGAVETLASQRADLQRSLAKCEADLEGLSESAIDEQRKLGEDLALQASKIVLPEPPEDPTPLVKELQERNAKAEDLVREAKATDEQLGHDRKTLEGYDKKLNEALANSPWNFVEVTAQDLMNLPNMPLAYTHPLGDLVRYAAKNRDMDLRSLEEEAGSMRHSIGGYEKTAKRIAAESLEVTQGLPELTAKVEALEKARSDYDTQAALAEDLRVMSANALTESTGLANHRKQLVGYQTTWSDQIRQLDEQIETLHTQAGVGDPELAKRQIAALEGQVAAVTERLNARRKQDALATELEACILRARQAQVDHEVGTAYAKAVKAVREAMMDDLIKPMMTHLRGFLAGRDIYCRLTNDRGTSIFELGWVSPDGPRVSIDAMSGGEATVFCAGLTYAMTMVADPPFKMLLIEAAELDDDNFMLLMTKLVGVTGKVDHAMVATSHWPASMPAGVLAYDMGGDHRNVTPDDWIRGGTDGPQPEDTEEVADE